jgi:hypothetical protein
LYWVIHNIPLLSIAILLGPLFSVDMAYSVISPVTASTSPT